MKNNRPGLTGFIFLCVGIGLCAWSGYNLKQGLASQNWPIAEGQVVSAEIESKRKRSSDSSGNSHTRVVYEPKVEYVYIVNGRRLNGDTVSFGRMAGDRGSAERVIQRYGRGTLVQVAYDGSDPSVSVLEPGMNWMMGAIAVAGLALVGLGTTALMACVFGWRIKGINA